MEVGSLDPWSMSQPLNPLKIDRALIAPQSSQDQVQAILNPTECPGLSDCHLSRTVVMPRTPQ